MTIGYIYKPNDKLGLFEGAEAGQVVSNPNREAPWLVVNHSLEGANIACWPGRLWRVEIVDALEPQNHRGNYTRSISVRIIEEIKTEPLFGENGAKIESILRYADALDLPAAEALAAFKSTEVDGVVTAGWHRWLAETQTQKTDPSHAMNGVVATGNGVQRSPVGHGLSLIHRCVSDSAERAMGKAAFEEDEDGIWLLPPWSVAGDVLSAAAWAYGAPDVFSADEIEILLKGWAARPLKEGNEP